MLVKGLSSQLNASTHKCFYAEANKKDSLDLVLVVAVSGGVLLSLLALLIVVVTVIICWCIRKQKQIHKR